MKVVDHTISLADMIHRGTAFATRRAGSFSHNVGIYESRTFLRWEITRFRKLLHVQDASIHVTDNRTWAEVKERLTSVIADYECRTGKTVNVKIG